MAASQIQPGLLRKMTVRKILESLQELGPLSRADLTRETGISAPTVSNAVSDLLDSGLLEEGNAPDNALGRPGKRLQLARDSAQVIGVVLDVYNCRVVSSSLAGEINHDSAISFSTPGDYDALNSQLVAAVAELTNGGNQSVLGIGISTPGLVDEETETCLFSPNLRVTNSRSPGRDLATACDTTATCIQETRALCLAERLYGNARGLDDFAMLDISSGLGLGVFSGGDLLRGHHGLAGELGHVTVDPGGKTCGCGNVGCLETLATDSALAAMISDRDGNTHSIEDVVNRLQTGALKAGDEVGRVAEYLSIAMAAAINLFNPSALFIHGQFLSISESIRQQVIELTRRRTLAPSFSQCSIDVAVTTKDKGAVAAIVHHLTQATGPRVTT